MDETGNTHAEVRLVWLRLVWLLTITQKTRVEVWRATEVASTEKSAGV